MEGATIPYIPMKTVADVVLAFEKSILTREEARYVLGLAPQVRISLYAAGVADTLVAK